MSWEDWIKQEGAWRAYDTNPLSRGLHQLGPGNSTTENTRLGRRIRG